LPILSENVELHIRRQIWFQQDGAPAHSTKAVLNLLNEKYSYRWIGRKGYVAWLFRSTNLTPLDYFLWGYVILLWNSNNSWYYDCSNYCNAWKYFTGDTKSSGLFNTL